MQSNPVPGTAGYTGGGATVTDEHGVKTGKAYAGDAQTGVETGAVPATAGYSGGGATATDEHGVKTGKQYEEGQAGDMDCCKGIHAAHGGAGGPATQDAEHTQNAPTGSTIGAGAGATQPVQVIPNDGPKENPNAMDKAKVKTAALVAGVQEDLNGLKQRLTGTQVGEAAGQGRPTDAPTRGERGPVYTDETDQPSTATGAQGKPNMNERATNFAVKTVDHAQAALEGAKQKITNATTQPAQPTTQK